MGCLLHSKCLIRKIIAYIFYKVKSKNPVVSIKLRLYKAFIFGLNSDSLSLEKVLPKFFSANELFSLPKKFERTFACLTKYINRTEYPWFKDLYFTLKVTLGFAKNFNLCPMCQKKLTS